MAKLQEAQGQFFLTIPKLLVKQKNWTKGQELLLMFNERGNIEITDNINGQKD